MYSKYLQNNNFEKHLADLKKKLKNKRVLIYGAGQIFKYIKDHYDISDLNIVGICDKQFTEKQNGKELWNYKTINVNHINEYDYDCVLIGVLKYYNLGYIIRAMIEKKNIEFYPLVRQNFKNLINDFFQQKNLMSEIFNITGSYFAFENNIICKIFDYCTETYFQNIIKKSEENQKRILKKLRKKAKTKKIKVGFLCFDSARWKCQSLYELLEKDEHFEPFIIMSRLYIGRGNQTRLQTSADFDEKCRYFKEKHKIVLGYNPETNKYLPLDKFDADYIFYQLPFYCNPIQMPKYASKSSLTAYVPYCVALTTNETKYETFFRACLHKYYLPYKEQKDYYTKNMRNNGKNICITGHTSLDDFYLKEIPERKNKKITVIYSPHHSNESNSPLKLGTFLEMGETILDYAKKHPEINWIFRPHPLLKNVLKTFMTEDKIEKYYKDWQTIGTYDTDGDYMDKFFNSDLLINDCGFILEYFPTGRPLIQLINPDYAPYDDLTERVLDTCYKIEKKEELKEILDKIIIEKLDYKKTDRENLIKELKLKETYAAQNILNDMKNELEIG